MAEARIKVWDAFVRIFHWSLVLAFFVAYFTEPEDAALAVHVWAGYLVTGLIVLRVIWGFVGTKHARFGDFAFAPAYALRYLVALARGRAKRYLGHSPAGAWMVYLLLASLAVTVATGMATLAEEDHAGPLAPFFAAPAAPAVEASREESHEGAEAFEEIHELFANIVLVLVGLHIVGVAVASFSHRENLVRAMVTGAKRADPEHDPG
jgi:cytochrome b